MAKQLKRKGKTNKVRNQGESSLGAMRGPNTGAWEKVFSGWRGRQRYSREWNSQYRDWHRSPGA